MALLILIHIIEAIIPDTHIIKTVLNFHNETISTLFSCSAHNLRSAADPQLSSQCLSQPADKGHAPRAQVLIVGLLLFLITNHTNDRI